MKAWLIFTYVVIFLFMSCILPTRISFNYLILTIQMFVLFVCTILFKYLFIFLLCFLSTVFTILYLMSRNLKYIIVRNMLYEYIYIYKWYKSHDFKYNHFFSFWNCYIYLFVCVFHLAHLGVKELFPLPVLELAVRQVRSSLLSPTLVSPWLEEQEQHWENNESEPLTVPCFPQKTDRTATSSRQLCSELLSVSENTCDWLKPISLHRPLVMLENSSVLQTEHTHMDALSHTHTLICWNVSVLLPPRDYRVELQNHHVAHKGLLLGPCKS